MGLNAENINNSIGIEQKLFNEEDSLHAKSCDKFQLEGNVPTSCDKLGWLANGVDLLHCIRDLVTPNQIIPYPDFGGNHTVQKLQVAYNNAYGNMTLQELKNR